MYKKFISIISSILADFLERPKVMVPWHVFYFILCYFVKCVICHTFRQPCRVSIMREKAAKNVIIICSMKYSEWNNSFQRLKTSPPRKKFPNVTCWRSLHVSLCCLIMSLSLSLSLSQLNVKRKSMEYY